MCTHNTLVVSFNLSEDKFSTRVRERWLKDMFDEADKNGDGTLDLKEVVQMMKLLNVGDRPSGQRSSDSRNL